MKIKDKLAVSLRAFKLGNVDFDYTMDFIWKVTGKRFTFYSFLLGFHVGGILALIILELCK